MTGKVIVNHQKQTISITGQDGKRSVNFADVTEVKTRTGKHYIAKSLTEGSALVVLLVKGYYSLLINEGNKLFYVEKNDSMFVISQQHMARALPIIFGEAHLTAYYAKSNIKPQYSARYLKNLTVFGNQSEGSETVVLQENLNHFKTSVYIGPYLAYGYNKTAFDVMMGYVKGFLTYRKTSFASSNSIPVGLRAGVKLSRRIGIDLSAYVNKTTAKNIHIDSTGIHDIPFPQSVLIPEKYDTDLKTSGFSYTTIHLDLAMTVGLTRNESSKFQPYALVGPPLAFMTKNEIEQAAGFRDSPQTEMTYFYRWSKLDRKQFLVGFNAGLGMDYSLGKRINLNASAKFLGGIYPKINKQSFINKTQNDTPLPDSQFGTFNSGFSHPYDQYMRMFTAGISATYRL